MTTTRFDGAVAALRYLYPATVFAFFLVASAVTVFTLQSTLLKSQTTHPRRRVLIFALAFHLLLFVADLVIVCITSWNADATPIPENRIVSLISCVLAFGIQLVGLWDEQHPVWYPYYGSWVLSILFEIPLTVLAYLGSAQQELPTIDLVTTVLSATRVAILVLTFATYFIWRPKTEVIEAADEERQALLQTNANGAAQNGSYGGVSKSNWVAKRQKYREAVNDRLKKDGNWWTYSKGFLIFWPYIWPVNNRGLQFRALCVALCLLSDNVLNLLTPRQLGIAMDSLNGTNHENPWIQIALFATFKLIGSQAALGGLRRWLWVPVEQYHTQALNSAAFSHVMRLSADFHDNKSSGDVISAINSGGNIASVLESLCFKVVPSVIDLAIAFVYLAVIFGPYEGLITVLTAVVYLHVSTRLVKRMRQKREDYISSWYEQQRTAYEGIEGWQTAAMFNQIPYEVDKFGNLVNSTVLKSRSVEYGFVFSYAVQDTLLLSGLTAGLLLAAYQILHGKATPGQFVMLITYWAQLSSPLYFFASMSKQISTDLMYAERLRTILETKPTVVDKDDAKVLRMEGGSVEFDDVCFSYDSKKEILKHVSLKVEAGKTYALVGATGAGKSTILKLLDRFYDVKGGSIKIDGQDVRDVQVDSLRAHIGIVPQNPILFNDTIINNIRYARLTATKEEVHEACKAASIHDQIMTFTDGYDSKVGENGVKLSGGEKQRVAIARAILKQPTIVLLDEATSSVDTETEQRIQEGLKALCSGRTTIIVAHRLSTIMRADCIVVVNDGQIIEQGNHEELISAEGKYAELWSKQIFVKESDNKSEDESKNSELKPNLVNDLKPEVATTEIAKASKSTKDQAGPSGSGEAQGHSNGTAETPTAHKREGSKLNPVAPTFTPQSFIQSSLS